MKKRHVRTIFDKTYYHKYYLNPKTRAHGLKELQPLVDHVLTYLTYLDIRVRSVLDVGCGLGLWKHALKRRDSGITFTGIDTSEHLCRKCGWTSASIADFRSRSTYDLIICQSLFQYLTADEIRAGLKNLFRLCRGAMYLDILTRED